MAEYPNFKHGTRGEIRADGIAFADNGSGKQAIVYIGTAPVHLVEGGAKNVNRPMLIKDISDAKRYMGYSDNWADYTLCEAMHAHFDINGVGPLVFINVLDPAKHKADQAQTASLTPVNGVVRMVNAENIVLDSIAVKAGEKQLEKGTDFEVRYNYSRKVMEISEKAIGALGTEALTITYDTIDPAKVADEDVIGSTDGYGLNTGIYAVKSVYTATGCIPAFMLAPGFSSVKAIHDEMLKNSEQISGHWNAWVFADMPLTDAEGNALTLQNAATWKKSNGYTADNESVFFPMVKGTDGRKYHISVLNAANFQTLLIQNSGIPYMTGSNTDCPMIEDLYFGEDMTGRVIDDEVINRTLNANGINSAAYVGGRWAIWGMFAASYNQEDATLVNVNDTCLMMLQYLTNDFQHRRNKDVDKPLQANDLKAMVAEEQTRVDALLGIGALTYGKVALDVSEEAKADVYTGDYRVIFNVTNTPLSKSLTAVANWTDDGFAVHFAALTE